MNIIKQENLALLFDAALLDETERHDFIESLDLMDAKFLLSLVLDEINAHLETAEQPRKAIVAFVESVVGDAENDAALLS